MKHYRLMPMQMQMQFVAHLFRRVTSAAFAKAGITRAQPWILDYLSEHDGCIQRELADRSHFDPASITSALAGMEEQGYVRRESVKGDKRALRVYLTELGREKVVCPGGFCKGRGACADRVHPEGTRYSGRISAADPR